MRYVRTTLILSFLTCLFFLVHMIPVAIGQTANPVNTQKVIKLNKVLPSDVLGDKYGPVLFRHEYHADIVKDCSVCHHYFNEHYNDQLVPADKCDSCHKSEKFATLGRNLPCDTCHDTASAPSVRAVTLSDNSVYTIPGLKAAYHRNCLDCHQNMGGPQGCGDCHLANAPDHSKLVGKYDGSGTCEACHPGKIKEIQNSTHYRLNQPYSANFLTGDNNPKEVGMLNRMGRLWGTDAITGWNANSPFACKNCHIGYGLIPYTAGEEKIFPESEYGNVDCLICHASGDYSPANPDRMSKNFTGLLDYAKKVDHTSAETCQRCHTALTSTVMALAPDYSGLRGTVYSSTTDIHAKYGMNCFDCHYEQGHRFQRQVSATVQASDTPRAEQSCSRCHREAHTRDNYKKMTSRMACVGCHVPDRGGEIWKNLENPSQPTQLKSRFVFKWFNRTADVLGTPYGGRSDGMLFPYRIAVIREPLDADGNILNVDLSTGTVLGQVASWREREIYLSMSHGVTLQNAYKCSDCHGASSKFNWADMDLRPSAFEQ